MIHRFVIDDPDSWLVEYQGYISEAASLVPLAAVASAGDGFDLPGVLKLEPTPGGPAMFELAFYVDDTQLSPEQFILVQRSLA